jgi:hypothetical protein
MLNGQSTRKATELKSALPLSIEELSSKGSPAGQDAFAYLRKQLKADGNVEETVEYEPLKETEAPSYNVRETPASPSVLWRKTRHIPLHT